LIVVRNSTERPESIAAGFARLVQPGPRIGDVGRMLLADRDLHRRLAAVECPYGDGHASERIAGHARRLAHLL
jgi:UDP-N-acetylglucosamine 2-epimerase (non-hydrolysing)